jgi:hypothetical protein
MAQEKDRVKEGRDYRQKILDKVNVEPSTAHTYDPEKGQCDSGEAEKEKKRH